jgi:hypothetical protein
MKEPGMKKGPRNIPDFSNKKKSGPLARAQDDKLAPPSRAPTNIAKPKATSSKSGRRGS